MCAWTSLSMSAAEADLPHNITKLKENLKILTGERDDLNKILLNYEADSLFTQGNIVAGTHLVKKIFNNRRRKEINRLAKKIVEKSPDTVVLFGIKTEANAQLLFQCAEKTAHDMSRLMEAACLVINGRGGGRPQQAQGGGPAVEKIEDALQRAEDMLFRIIR